MLIGTVVLYYCHRVSTQLQLIKYINILRQYKVKWSHYTPVVAYRVGKGIALLFHDRGTRRAWVVSSTPRPHSTPGKDPVPILQEAGWAPESVWMGGKSRPQRDSIPDRLIRSQSLYRLSYPAHTETIYRVSQEECASFRESVPYVKVYRYNPKHQYPKLNGYGDNGQRRLKLWQLLHTYWLPNTY